MPGTIRLAPTLSESDDKALIVATGIPASSIRVEITAPQREQVPHVEVSITPETPSAMMSAAISSPTWRQVALEAPTPTTE